MSPPVDSRSVGQKDSEVQVLVCFAVREESRYFTPPSNPSTDVLTTGIGVQKTSTAINNYLKAHQPKLVMTCGFAGGLNRNLDVGTVVFDCSGASRFKDRFVNLGALPGIFSHSDRVVVTAQEKQKLHVQTGADAVEMESSAIVAACRVLNIPVIILRVISDSAGEDLPLDFNRYSKPDGSLSMPRLLGGIALAPSSIPRLVRFNGRLKTAAERLGSTLERFLALGNLF